MADSSITHPDDTPVNRIDILKMDEARLREYIELIQTRRKAVFEKAESIKKSITRARQDEVVDKIKRLLERADAKVKKSDKYIEDAMDILAKYRALELELDYSQPELPLEDKNGDRTEMDHE